jgi:hypothetical protein
MLPATSAFESNPRYQYKTPFSSSGFWDENALRTKLVLTLHDEWVSFAFLPSIGPPGTDTRLMTRPSFASSGG